MTDKKITVGRITDLGSGGKPSVGGLPKLRNADALLLRQEIAVKALRNIINVIGGGSCARCQGCDAEMREAERIANEALEKLKVGRA